MNETEIVFDAADILRCGKDLFVHFRSIVGEGHRSLVEGQEVEFKEVAGEKGPQAEEVVPK